MTTEAEREQARRRMARRRAEGYVGDKARNAAIKRLIDSYPIVYRRLLAEERARLEEGE